MTSTYDHRVIQGAESGRFLGAHRGATCRARTASTRACSRRWASARAAAAPRCRRRGAAAAAPRRGRPGARQRGAAAGRPGGHSARCSAFRSHGHLAARLDPLGSEPEGDPALDPEPLGLTPEIMAQIPAQLFRMYVPGDTLAEALPAPARDLLRHDRLRDRAHRLAPPARVAARAHRVAAHSASRSRSDEQHALLKRLVEVDALERFMHKAYLGQHQFSIEGLDMTVPMLDELIQLSAARGGQEVVDRDGPPRPAERARPQPRARLRHDLRRVRGRLDARGGDDDPAGRHRRRQVPPRHAGHLPARRRRHDPRQPRVQPEPPRVRLAGRRGRDARGADLTPRARTPHQDTNARGADRDPRRRLVPGPGRRRRDAQPAGARRLQGRRHGAPDHEQPDRLHDRSRRRALDALGLRPRQGLRRADHPRQRRRRRRPASARCASRSPSARSSATTS